MASANNIEAFRLNRGWSRPRLAELMGTSPQQVERLEKGQRRLSREWIDKAATAFGVDPEDIISAKTPLHLPIDRPTAIPDQQQTIGASDGETVELQMLDLSFSMGPGTNIESYVEETPVQFDLGMLRSITRSPFARIKLARGVGDSMMPTLLSSDVVMIDTTQRMLNMQDKIWAVSIFGASAIKRLRLVGQSRVQVISDNPAVDPQDIDTEDLIILGRVIWAAREL